MDDDVVVRVAGPTEIAEAARMRWTWVVDEKGGEPHGSEAEFVEGTVAWAERNADTHTCFVAEIDDEVVGMAWMAVAPRVPSPRAFERRNADVQSVYVSPSVRGRGVGAQLMRALVDAAASVGAERVTVHSSPEAVRMYERAGFSVDPLLLDQSLPKR
ncbi:acetyltransferase (GNAT) family protein [Labedella gwakjiensis]|uniref:Acetyltransferase (GNAT) family protein n=1 Tax=Labedella gwakjiensis TaxID=390269 RepID=A0A2P8GUR5_9MICO|nr:GNAT family N-acetyltransferase [Labedella gwakjiensis]PSL37696.1 acetyltransferase (GNAT) family protein [Labedella gwakjiensis]RUQ87711.1 GNAT family N-acetyltransferase [Labedella gwakjiensis]